MKNAASTSFLIFLAFFYFPLKAQNNLWTLKACIDTGIARNITVQQGQLSAQANKINLEQSKDNLWPDLNITDAPNFTFGKTQGTGGNYLGENTTANSFAITSNVTLFGGSELRNTIKQNQLIYDASQQGVEKMKNDVTLNILAGYLLVIASYDEVDIANSQLAADSIQVQETKVFVDAGKYPILNLYQVQSQQAADKYSKVNALAQLQLAKVNLMQLMDIPVVNNFDVTRPVVNDDSLMVTPLSPGDIDKTAEGFLPEIKNAELNSSAGEVGIKLAQSLYQPKLTLSAGIRTYGSTLAYQESYAPGTIGYLQSNPSELVTGLTASSSISNTYSNLWTQLNDNFNQGIGLSLTIPIFNNFQARNSTALAKINYINATLNEEQVKLTLRQSIEQAYTQLLVAAEQYNAAKEELKTEALTYTNMEKKYETGTSNATDLLVEKANYLKAQQNVVQAKYTYLFKEKLIGFYLGKPITL